MSRPLRDRLGEAMREARVGRSSFGWDQCDQEDYRRSADALLRLADRLGFKVVDAGEEQIRPALPQSATAYAVHAATSDGKRALRCLSRGLWAVVGIAPDGQEKILLKIDIADADAECDRILAGDPTVKDAPGILTRVAAANLIRTINAEQMEP